MVIAAEDLLEYYIHDPDTRVIAMFLEGIRHPKRFMELASRALEAGKPIVALKVGLTDRGSRISKGHTGSLAGSGRVNEAAMEKAGVIQVYDLDEMFETVELLSKVRRPKGPRIALTSISGGELGICADMWRAAALKPCRIYRRNQVGRPQAHGPGRTGACDEPL